MFSPLAQSENRYRDASSPGNIEPMSLGSPVSSPKNKGGQNYLPPYLFGETVTSPVASPSWSTPQNNISVFQSPSNLNTPVSQFREQHMSSYRSPSSNSLITAPTPTKSGGPPIQGLLYSSPNPRSLFDNSQYETPPVQKEKLASEGHNFSNVLSPNNSLCIANTSCMSPAQIDPFFTQGEALKNSDQLDESWVTVFGFPAASSPYILQQFSQYGNIVEHKLSPNGNWMHVRYQSKLQAKKALSKNGKVFSGNIMIGVKPCIEMDLMESFRDDSVQESTLAKGQDSFRVAETSFEPTRPSLKNIRPLTQAYQSPSSQSPVTVAKSGNMVSKAFEYLWKLH